MAENILLVFEGEKTENNILNNLKKYYLNGANDVHICATFNTDIYRLYKEIQDDELSEYLDIVEVLRARPHNKDALKGITRQDISQVFLIFDYDGHATQAADNKITELLQHFSEETENGKLYISYPMIEALKHLKKDIPFETVSVDCKDNIRYKGLAHRESEPNLRNYTDLSHESWKYIISQHSKKVNHLLFNTFEFPKEYFTQQDIFQSQLKKHITPRNQVAVLCAFPLLILDYYGASKLEKLIS